MKARVVQYALLITILAVIGSTTYGFLSGLTAREWETRAMLELERAEVAREKVRELLARVTAAEESADSIAADARELGVRVRERVADVRKRAAPDPVPPVIVRDQIIDTLFVVAETWEEAYKQEVKASDMLRVAFGLQTMALDSLTAVLENRPTPRPRLPQWLPTARPGVFMGVCNDGRGCMGIGITLSWSIQ